MYNKCGHKYKTIFKEESIEILQILGLITNLMSEKNITQECRLKNIDETRNYLIEEISQN